MVSRYRCNHNLTHSVSWHDNRSGQCLLILRHFDGRSATDHSLPRVHQISSWILPIIRAYELHGCQRPPANRQPSSSTGNVCPWESPEEASGTELLEQQKRYPCFSVNTYESPEPRCSPWMPPVENPPLGHHLHASFIYPFKR